MTLPSRGPEKVEPTSSAPARAATPPARPPPANAARPMTDPATKVVRSVIVEGAAHAGAQTATVPKLAPKSASPAAARALAAAQEEKLVTKAASPAAVRVPAAPQEEKLATKAASPTAVRGPAAHDEKPAAKGAAGTAREPAGVAKDEVDVAFERLTSDLPPAAAVSPVDGTRTRNGEEDAMAKEQHAELFRELAAEHARPLRDLMLELTIGPTTRQWLDIVRPSLRNLVKAATALEQNGLATALGELERALEGASKGFGARIEGEPRAALLAQYEKLTRSAPGIFDLQGDQDQREMLVVHHLLLQIPSVHKVTIDKLYGAGLSSLVALCRASVDDLLTLGVCDRESAERIVTRFQSYWRERTERPVQQNDVQVKGKLRVLLEQLTRAHERFQAAEAREDREQKRRARSERRARGLDLHVLLAQLGELELVAELERLPTERRIERMRSYLEVPKNGSSGRPEAG